MKEEGLDFKLVAEAFSRKAQEYGSFGEDHPLLMRMREKVRQHVLCLLPNDGRILELNAGSGGDALFFVQKGHYVYAIDIAPGMVTYIREIIESFGLEGRLCVDQLSFTELNRLQSDPFHLVFSNMGGLNCLEDLSRATKSLSELLYPGGYVVWVIMPPLCLWEIAQFLRGRFNFALRRIKRATTAFVEGINIRIYYHTVGQAVRAFEKHFHLVSVRGLSVFTPPADHKSFPFNHARSYRWMCRLDDLLSDRFPFNHMGDFYILTLRYEPPRAFNPFL